MKPRTDRTSERKEKNKKKKVKSGQKLRLGTIYGSPICV